VSYEDLGTKYTCDICGVTETRIGSRPEWVIFTVTAVNYCGGATLHACETCWPLRTHIKKQLMQKLRLMFRGEK
jgi:hypothetical protein